MRTGTSLSGPYTQVLGDDPTSSLLCDLCEVSKINLPGTWFEADAEQTE